MAKRDNFFINYKKNLLSLFQFLASEPVFKDNVLAASIGPLHQTQKLLQASSKLPQIQIDLPLFTTKLNQGIECGAPNDAFLSFGGPISIDESGRIEQSISVCLIIDPHDDVTKCDNYCRPDMDSNNKHIIRRFHFDFDSTQTQGDRPISHIQYGGNLNDAQKEDFEYRLISSFDLPRIPSIPLDAIQVINFFLHQFNTEISPVVSKPGWRSIVVENDAIWKEFYIQNLLNSLNKQNTLYELICTSKP